MNRPKVLHQMYSYLPVTQNWVYPQIALNNACDQAAVSLTEEHPEQFPLDTRFTAFVNNRLLDRIGLLLARYWVSQPVSFFRSVLLQVKPDLVHGHFATESYRILSCCTSAKIPLVTTFYGLDVDKLSRRRSWKKRYRSLFVSGALFFAEGPFMARQIEKLGCPAEKIEVIPIGIDIGKYPEGIRRSHDGTVQIMFVGLNREKKGALDAAEIFSRAALQNKHLHLEVIGNGKYKQPMLDRLRAASVMSQVTFHGQCSVEKYRNILSRCDLLLAPSFHAADGDSEGGAPVVCIEALASRIPVIGTRHCDIPFVVEHEKCGLLSAEHDVAAMTNDLLALACNNDMRHEMGLRARQKAVQQHDSRNVIMRINQHYQKVITGFQGQQRQ